MTSEQGSQAFRVVVAGGGVAGIETIIALRELAGPRVAIDWICPDEDFVYQPMSVREPFAHASAQRRPIDRIAADFRAHAIRDALDWVAPGKHAVFTRSGAEVGYDALVLALGARREEPFDQVVTFRGQEDSAAVRGIVQDVENGYTRSVAFVVPPGMAWPLPLYELALMTAARAAEMQVDAELTVVTPEETPLGAFGAEASADVAERLHEAGIAVELASYASVERGRTVILHPSGRTIAADRVVAVPALLGTAPRGIPDDGRGFIPVDVHGRVRGIKDVYAAGDGVAFPIKQGGIAAQQADAVAEVIAKRAGAPIEPRAFRPVMRGILLTGTGRRFLRGEISRGRDQISEAGDQTLWWPADKIAGRYIAPYLAGEMAYAERVTPMVGHAAEGGSR
jgi:sulfide:quinone oxidoreductase